MSRKLVLREEHLDRAIAHKESSPGGFVTVCNCFVAQAAKEQFEDFSSCGFSTVVLKSDGYHFPELKATEPHVMNQLVDAFDFGQYAVIRELLSLAGGEIELEFELQGGSQ